MNTLCRSVIVSLTILSGQSVLADDSVQAGEKAFRYKCVGCHEHTAYHRTVGPDLNGVFNRKAGSLPQGIYSRALMDSNIVWDDKTLDEFLSGPSDKIPMTFMPFHGVSDAQERMNIIAFLKTLGR